MAVPLESAIIRRALISTHHMTSMEKIQIIRKSAKALGCAIVLKIGSTPGVMVAEGSGESVDQWVNSVKVSDWRRITSGSIC